MELASRINGIGNVITAGLNLYQTAEYSKRAQSLEQSRHEEEMELMRQQHRKELITAKQTYLISTFTDIERFCQELNENLVNSTKDAERDMVDQRSQQFQTILLAGTIMIASVMNILIQGPLPRNASEFSKIAYSFTNCSSVFFIGLNMLLCIQLIYRVTQFMYRRSEMNLAHLREAMSETRTVMQNIRGDAGIPDRVSLFSVGLGASAGEEVEEAGAAAREELDEEEKIEQEDAFPAPESMGGVFKETATNRASMDSNAGAPPARGIKRKPSNRSHISRLSSAEVDAQWEQHETEVHTYLHRRSAINERREMMRFGNISFEIFWNRSCKDTGSFALVSFYIGTSLMLLATMVYFWNTYVLIYTCLEGAVVAVVTIGASLFLCLGFAVYLRFFDPSINDMREDTTSLVAPDDGKEVKFD